MITPETQVLSGFLHLYLYCELCPYGLKMAARAPAPETDFQKRDNSKEHLSAELAPFQDFLKVPPSSLDFVTVGSIYVPSQDERETGKCF